MPIQNSGISSYRLVNAQNPSVDQETTDTALPQHIDLSETTTIYIPLPYNPPQYLLLPGKPGRQCRTHGACCSKLLHNSTWYPENHAGLVYARDGVNAS